MPLLKPNDRKILFVVGIGFALVSATCQVLLFVEGETGLDYLINWCGAVLLVVCQFLFVYLVPRLWRGHWFIALIMAVTVAALFWVSVSASASYFEARFEKQKHKGGTQSGEYLEQTELINSHKADYQKLKALADKEEAKGNDWQASQNMKNADRAKQNWQDALKERGQIKTTGVSSNEVLAANYEGNEKAIWYVYAVLFDLCALLCFAVLGIPDAKQKSSESQDEEQPESAITRLVTEEAPETEKDALYEIIKQEILAGVYGVSPSQRKVKLAHGFNSNPRVKAIFDQLELEKIIWREEGSRIYQTTKKAA